jgi:hypothetical protein
MEIITALIGVALIALLINKSQNTAQLIQTGGSTLNDLLRTVSLQNGAGNY